MKAIVQQNLPFVTDIYRPIDPTLFPKTAGIIRCALDAPGLAAPGRNFPTLLLAPLARLIENDRRNSIVVRRDKADCTIEFYNQVLTGKPNYNDHYVSVSIAHAEPEWLKKHWSRQGDTWNSYCYYNTVVKDDTFDLRKSTRYCRPVHKLIDLLDALIEDEDNLRDVEGNEIVTPDLRFVGTVHQVLNQYSPGERRVLIHRVYTLNGIWVSVTVSHAVTQSDPLVYPLFDFMTSGDDEALASDYGFSFDLDPSLRLSLRAYRRKNGSQHTWSYSDAEYQLDALPQSLLPAFISPFDVDQLSTYLNDSPGTMHGWLGELLLAEKVRILAYYEANDNALETYYFAAPGGLFRLMFHPL